MNLLERNKLLGMKQCPYIFGNQAVSKNQSIESIVATVVNYFQSIIGCMPGNVYWLNEQSLTVGCNENVLRMFGMKSIAEFTGLTFEDMARIGRWSKEATQRFKEDTFEVLKSGLPKFNIEENPIPDATGKLIYFLTSRVPLFDQDKKIIGTVGISIDITERKQMEADLIAAKEKAESALKAKSDFLALVSHELRTPLTGILGIVDVLLAETQSEQQKTHLTHVNSASKHLLALINNILDFSKLNEEKFCLTHKPFDLRDVFTQVFNMLNIKANEKKLALILDYSSNYPRYFLGDQRALMQILINLIGNAIKFTKTGGISVKVSEEQRTESHTQFTISVTDTGMGIPPEHLDSIFQRFEQLGAIQTSAEFGTGLGLLVSRKIAELMNSQITVESTVGKGTTFSMRIKFELNPDATAGKSEEIDEPINPLKQSGLKLLLIDDDSLIQTIHKLKFLSYGFEVNVAADGLQALELCALQRFDIIFVDIGLPNISGNEVIAHLRQNEGLNTNTKLIALTAYADEVNHEQSSAAGANDILCKPTSNKILNTLFAEHF